MPDLKFNVATQIVMTSDQPVPAIAPSISLAIFAWNEERALSSTLESLFEQSLFARFHQRQAVCEVFCVANGCTDGTAEVATQLFRDLSSRHAHASAMVLRVANIRERGKVNAWNQFVHHLSARSAGALFMMDADILIHRKDTLQNMLATLEHDPDASVVVDVPRKHIENKARRSLAERLSVAASRMTLAAGGQLCGQLYCIRAEVARRIYLPKDLSACEDGLIKTFVCTDFLAHSAWPQRIRVAANAEHTFEAYTTPRSILKNQKRQIIGQTIIHVLVDRFLNSCPAAVRLNLGQFLQEKDATDPAWLKRLISEHLQQTRYPWKLYPDLVGNRFRRLRGLRPLQRLMCLPAALAASGAAIAASFLAHRSLRSGCIDYWPKAQRAGLKAGPVPDSANVGPPVTLTGLGGVK